MLQRKHNHKFWHCYANVRRGIVWSRQLCVSQHTLALTNKRPMNSLMSLSCLKLCLESSHVNGAISICYQTPLVHKLFSARSLVITESVISSFLCCQLQRADIQIFESVLSTTTVASLHCSVWLNGSIRDCVRAKWTHSVIGSVTDTFSLPVEEERQKKSWIYECL